MKIRSLCMLIIMLLLCFYTNISFALVPETHEEINKHIADNSGGYLDGYLKANLNFSSGRETIFINKSVVDWIGLGGITEEVFRGHHT